MTIGIEVGVRDGNGSRRILRDNIVEYLIGLDIRDNAEARKVADEFPGRYKFVINKSPEYASIFSDELFDYIYIDADHSYEGVKADLNAWWPKLKTGGIMEGDDYLICENPTEGHYGVVQALEEFIEQRSLSIKINNQVMNSIERLLLAQKLGKQVEDNLWLIHSYLFPASAMLGRVRTENIKIPQWTIQKGI